MLHIDPPSVYQNTLHWGVHHQYQVPIKKSIVYSCFPINRSEIIAITSNSIIRLEKATIKETAPLNLSTAIFIEKQNVIVGVSSTTSEFFFIRPYDLSHHIQTNVRTKQVPTFHILYSPNSSLLITAGKNIKIWNLKCIMPSRNSLSVPPVIEITLRNVIDSSFEADLINPPLFDYHNELLILAESTGFNAYNMDCKFVKRMTKLSTNPRTSAALSNESGNLITFESPTGSFYEWSSNGTLLRRSIVGCSSIVCCRYLNDPVVLFLDSKNNIYLYDTLTLKFFLCDQLPEKPSSILLYYTSTSFFPTFSVCYDNSIDFYEVVMPWKLWRSTMPKPHSIKLCKRKKRAARLLVHTDNEYIFLISPKTQQTVTTSSPSSPSKIIETFYDRGLDSGQQRDQLFTITYNDKLAISSTSTVPCTEITTIDNSIVSVFECSIENKSYYGSATVTGEIIVHDYDTFEPVKRYAVLPEKILTAKYDLKFSTVLLFYEHEIVRIDINSGNVVCQLNLNSIPEIGTVFDFKDQLALIGYKSGRISMISLDQTKMSNLAQEGCVFHNTEVTGFSISTNFFISVSTDQQMKFWSFSGSNILTLTLPLPLYSVEVINAKRDIVVGTDKDIMLIEGRTLFAEKFEPRDDEIDNYNEKNDELSDDSASSLYQIELQKQAMKSAWKENEDQNQAQKKGNRRNGGYWRKKDEMDEETRRRIIEKMLKMGDDPFTLNRIREREKRRFEEQKNQIQSEVDRERLKRQKEKEEEEKEKAKQAELERLIQQQKEEELENQRKKEQEELLKQNQQNSEIEDQQENEDTSKNNNEEEEEINENQNQSDNKNSLNESSSFNNFLNSLNNQDDSKLSQREKSPKKKKKKKKNDNRKDPSKNPTQLVYVDENGNKFRMLNNGDFVDENGKVYHKMADGTFVADDGTVWGGPDKTKGHFETADGGQIQGEFAPEGTVWISPDGKKYTSLGDGRWIGPDGEIYTMNPDGTFQSSDGKKFDGPLNQNLPQKWIGPDGKVYYLQPDGRYVAEDGTVWDKPMDGSCGGYFESPDGSKPGDTFVDQNGNVYTRTSESWIGPDGKLYRLGKDGKFHADDGSVLDDSNGQLFRNDGYNANDIYIAPDGTVYKRTPSNRGWIGPDGKIYRLNEKGEFVAEDGTVMPLSNEKLVWIDSSGVVYRPTFNGKEWISSDGKHYKLNEMIQNNEEEEDDEEGENSKPSNHRFKSKDGSGWSGPTASGGRFAGKDLFDTPIQWIDHSGNVYKPFSKDGSVYVNSNNQLFERQKNGEYIEKVDSEEKGSWSGPGKPSEGNWVNNKGQIIESLGGYWISPNNEIFTATKSGYISATAVLYKPTSTSETFVSITGEKLNGLGQIVSTDPYQNGQWVEANGDVYRPVDKSGNWLGPDGEIYSPQLDGNWVGQTSGKVWSGPPFISARKYFIKSHPFWMLSFHSPNRKPIENLEFKLGQRPSTPLYKVPPLLYPPFKSRFKAFQTRPPPKRKPKVVYTVPPPNIVVDLSQIVKLIVEGNTQLMTVAKRLGLQVSGELPSQKSDAAYESRLSQRERQRQRPPLTSTQSEELTRLPRLKMKSDRSDRNGGYGAIDEVNQSSSLPTLPFTRVKTADFDRQNQERYNQQIQPRPPPLPPINHRPTQQPPLQQLQSSPSAPLVQSNEHSTAGSLIPPTKNESIQQSQPVLSANPSQSLPPAPNNSPQPSIDFSSITKSQLQAAAPSSARLPDLAPRHRTPLIPSGTGLSVEKPEQRTNTTISSSFAFAFKGPTRASRLQPSSPKLARDSPPSRPLTNIAKRPTKTGENEASRMESPIPFLRLKQVNEAAISDAPNTERPQKRRLKTAYLSRAYQIHMKKPEGQTSREIVNPLIVKSMVKPEFSVPQQLFNPKRKS